MITIIVQALPCSNLLHILKIEYVVLLDIPLLNFLFLYLYNLKASSVTCFPYNSILLFLWCVNSQPQLPRGFYHLNHSMVSKLETSDQSIILSTNTHQLLTFINRKFTITLNNIVMTV